MNEPIMITSLPLLAGYQARTMVAFNGQATYEVATVDTRRIKYAEGTSPEVIEHLVGKYPFETTVYRLIDIKEPLTSFEEFFADTINVCSNYRRDFSLGDLYLSRSKTVDGAAIEHDSVVELLKTNKLDMLTQKERMAIYGIGETVN